MLIGPLAMLALLLSSPSTPPPQVHAAAPAEPTVLEEFHDLALWNNSLSTFCYLQGYWETSSAEGEIPRWRAVREGAFVRMSANISSEEVTYRMPVGGEVVTHLGWTLINGSGCPSYELVLEHPPEFEPCMAYRENERLVSFNGRWTERFTLFDGEAWQWTLHHATPNPTLWTAWHLGDQDGDVLGELIMAGARRVDIISAGKGVRCALEGSAHDGARVAFTSKDPGGWEK